MKYLNKKNILYLTFIIFIIRIVTLLICPYLPTDAAMAMSPSFSYYLGIKDSSVFAHEYLGDAFKIHIIDYFYFVWFKIFGLNTYSFIIHGILIIFATILVWIFIAKKIKNNSLILYILLFAYVSSPWIYNFRPENLVILIISLLLLLFLLKLNQIYELILSSLLCILAGLVHHIGGLIAVIICTYYFLEFRKTIYLLKFVVVGIVFSYVITIGEIFNYILLPLKFKSEVGNHLASFNVVNILRYFISSAPIVFILFYSIKNLFSKKDFIFLFFCILLLLFSGRTYYGVYVFPFMILMLIKNEKIILNIETKWNRFILKSSLIYTFCVLFLLQISLRLIDFQLIDNWNAISKAIVKEKENWNNDEIRYYVPQELITQVVNNKNARMYYFFMLKNDGFQNTENKVFYITDKNEIEWIDRAFNTKNKKIKIEELVKESNGFIRPISIVKFKIIRISKIGLWKITYI